MIQQLSYCRLELMSVRIYVPQYHVQQQRCCLESLTSAQFRVIIIQMISRCTTNRPRVFTLNLLTHYSTPDLNELKWRLASPVPPLWAKINASRLRRQKQNNMAVFSCRSLSCRVSKNARNADEERENAER